ncbi:MAG: DNRLRE domain-containing protein [Phycisphaerae bacterium]|nr:DNRLRE domain-containing protein [Phycisphaerae bacterium]
MSTFTATALALVVAASAGADTVTIELSALKDATLIQDSQELANGSGDGIYSGRVGPTGGGTRRRGLLAFDVAGAIPSGSTILSATLVLQLVATNSNTHVVSLHRVTAAWSEGPTAPPGGEGFPAAPGDVTWTKRQFPDLAWSTAGGSFVSTASAVTPVGQTESYAWTSMAMANDVQAWLDAPESNHGWLLRGNESLTKTAKKFASREAISTDYRPRLVLTYEPPQDPCAAADLDCDGIVGSADLGILLGAWGTAGPGDLDDDGVVGADDLSVLLGAWSA